MAKNLNARQKKLVKLLPKVASGELTKTEAIKKAGYSETTAHQQTDVLGGARNTDRMQKALRDAGMTEEYIAEEIANDTRKLEAGPTRLGYLKTGTELLDVVPSKKVDGNLKVSGRIFLSDAIGAADALPIEDDDA